MSRYYSDEGNIQILIALLKAHNIRYVVASPGNTNLTLVASLQYDPFFKIISSIDERSAAYIACGIAEEIGEPVMLNCTGATASRNYMSGLTEAFYRKLPILTVTSSRDNSEIGHLIPQVTDRQQLPTDIAKLSVQLPVIKDDSDKWTCQIKVNKALLELRRRGGGPVHINIPTTYCKTYKTKELPSVRVIHRFAAGDQMPTLECKRVAVFIGSHKRWSASETEKLNKFCESNNAVAFCDHTSGYYGKYRVDFSLIGGQEQYISSLSKMDILIHIGEISGDYLGYLSLQPKEVWRVSEDGEIRDTLHRLTNVFEMQESSFFEKYTKANVGDDSYLKECLGEYTSIYKRLEGSRELPLSNIYVAYKTSKLLPKGSRIHFGILSCLRSWDFFKLPEGVYSNSNVGGFGIDGCVSSLIGSAMVKPESLHFGVYGDLTFFYDMNALGNRHIGNNLRIIIINNGIGAEFGLYCYPGSSLGQDVEPNISAKGHYGNKSPKVVKSYVESLGFEYLSANTKEEFEANIGGFTNAEITGQSMVFEIFTNNTDDDKAFYQIRNLVQDAQGSLKKIAKKILSDDGKKMVRKILNK